MWQLRRACTHSVVVTTRLARVTRRRTITQQQPLSLMHSEAKPGTAGTSSSSSMAGECEAVATSSDDRRKGPRGGSDGSTPGGQGGTGARSASASASGASARDSTKPHDDSIFTMRAIGVVRSPFKQKFGIPRQPGLAPAAVATVELQPPFNNVDAVRGLEGWSHVWITFVFHGIPEQQVCVAMYSTYRMHAVHVVVLCFHVLDFKLCSYFHFDVNVCKTMTFTNTFTADHHDWSMLVHHCHAT